MLEVFDWAGVAAIEAEELAVVPGLDELFALTELESLVRLGRLRHHRRRLRADRRDDPTAVAARHPQLVHGPAVPGVASADPGGRPGAAPASRRCPSPTTRCSRRASASTTSSTAVRRILSDPAVTSARLVVNPERMVIAEARRTYTYLSLFGYQVDAVVVNRVLPDVAADPWFDDWRAIPGSRTWRRSSESFAPLPVFRAEHTGGEVVGLDALGRPGGTALVGRRPVDAGWSTISRCGSCATANDVVLSVELPFTERDEVDLTRNARRAVHRARPAPPQPGAAGLVAPPRDPLGDAWSTVALQVAFAASRRRPRPGGGVGRGDVGPAG